MNEFIIKPHPKNNKMYDIYHYNCGGPCLPIYKAFVCANCGKKVPETIMFQASLVDSWYMRRKAKDNAF